MISGLQQLKKVMLADCDALTLLLVLKSSRLLLCLFVLVLLVLELTKLSLLDVLCLVSLAFCYFGIEGGF